MNLESLRDTYAVYGLEAYPGMDDVDSVDERWDDNDEFMQKYADFKAKSTEIGFTQSYLDMCYTGIIHASRKLPEAYVEAAVQESVLGVIDLIQEPGKGPRPGGLRAYTYKAISNRCASTFRRIKLGEEKMELYEWSQSMFAPVSMADSVESRVMFEHMLSSVTDGATRETLFLREVEGMSYNEICKYLGVSIGVVKTRLYNGRKLIERYTVSQGEHR